MTKYPYANLTDRSRTLAFQRCPRKRYYEYELHGTGFTSALLNPDLEVGQAVHIGLGDMLRQGRDKVIHDSIVIDIGQATNKAVQYFTEKSESAQFRLDSGQQYNEEIEENAALVEALTYAWGLYRLPNLLQEYKIIDVEHEEVHELAPDLGWMARPDALLKSMFDGSYSVLSIKTAKSVDSRSKSQFRIDMQGDSERPGVEQRLGIEVNRVHLEILIKGYRRESPKGSGVYHRSNPLIRAWKQEGVTPELDEYSHSYYYHDGERNRRLGKGWFGTPMWKESGFTLREWVQDLWDGKHLAPRQELCNVVQNQFEFQILDRDADELWEWDASTTFQELRVADAAYDANEALAFRDRDEFFHVLNTAFPKYRQSCDYPQACWLKKICWEQPQTVFDLNPLELEEYKPRIAHHEPEAERMKEKK